MATTKKFNARHGLSIGQGGIYRDVIENDGTLIDVGNISTLDTTDKSSIVSAINEVNTITRNNEQIVISLNEPNGFEETTTSVLSFDNSTKTFAVSLAEGITSYYIWVHDGVISKRIEINSVKSIQLGNNSGLYYIYFDDNGDLQAVLGEPTSYKTKTPVAYVLWNQTTLTAALVGDLRHGISQDWNTHDYLQKNLGALVSSGFKLENFTLSGDGSLDSDAKIELSDGVFHNEDIEINIRNGESGLFYQKLRTPTQIPILYQNGASGIWVRESSSVYPVKTSATTIQYNLNNAGAWSAVPVPSGNYMATWLVASSDINFPIFCIIGQNQYTTQGEAEASNFEDLSLDQIPVQEIKPIWKLVWKTVSTYPNSPNAVLRNAIDLRSSFGTGVNDHGLLTGKEDDDHLQYLHINNTRQNLSLDITTSGIFNTSNTSSTSIKTDGGISVLGDGAFLSDLDVTGEVRTNKLGILGNGSFRTFIDSGSNLSNDITYVLPSGYGTNGQTIVSDGTGNLSWGASYFAGSTSLVVSEADGDDNNDGSLLPLRTIKKACQIASGMNKPVCIFIKAGDYTEQNPIVVPDDVSLVGDSLRSVIIRPTVSKSDIFRVRNGTYLTGMTFRDSLTPTGVPSFTWRYIIAFDDPNDSSVSREGYTNLPSTKPLITRSPYIQNCSIISFLGGSGVLVDGAKVVTPNTPTIAEEVERPVDGSLPEQGKSMVANAFTMLSFGGTGWRVVNDGYTQVVSCFQIFCKNGTYCQSGGYASITNSATNHGLYALRSQGYRAESFVFDRGYISNISIIDNKQAIEVLGTGREVINHYILKIYSPGTSTEITSQFKQASSEITFDPNIDVDYSTNEITYVNHGYINRQQVIYSSNGGLEITGLFDETVYYVNVIGPNTIKLFDDEELSSEVDLETGSYSNAHKLITNVEEFFVDGVEEFHNVYQELTLTPGPTPPVFNKGSDITGISQTATSLGTVWSYDPVNYKLVVSVNKTLVAGQLIRQLFVNGMVISDHSDPAVTATVSANLRKTDLYTSLFKISSIVNGNSVQNFENLENKDIRLHRPSIVNSSAHTWEYAGSGMDYNALPQNGARGVAEYEQYQDLPGRVYSSGTNELGDFKVGDSIVAENRTGNIFFKQTVTVGELSSLKLTISDITIEEISTDVGLGDNEVGGASNSRLSTQYAVRGFLDQKLGSFQGKSVSTNSIPGSVVQLNSSGKINVDLIPAVRTFNTYKFEGQDSRLEAFLDVPPIEILAGDFVTESVSGSDTTYVLQSDDISQYIVIDPTVTLDLTGISSVHGVISNADGQIDTSFGTGGLVKGIINSGNISNSGSGYTPSSGSQTYTNVTLTNVNVSGSPSGAKANIIVTDGVVSLIDFTRGGENYVVGDVLSANSADIGGSGSNFTITVSGVEQRLYLDLIGEKRKFVATSVAPDFISDANSPSKTLNNTFSSTKTFGGEATPTGGVDVVNDQLVISGGHGYTNGDLVYYDSGVNPAIGGLLSETSYYVKVINSTTVELYTSYNLDSGNKVSISSSSSGTHSLTIYSVNIDKDTIYLPSHGYVTGDAIGVSGSGVPGGLFSGNYYFVGSITTNTFTLHENKSAALDSINGVTNSEVDLTSSGTGSSTLKSSNIRVIGAINTSCKESDNWSFLSGASIDAANIVSGTIATTRLANLGTANSDTFLRGDQEWAYAVQSVYIDPNESNGLQLSNGGTHQITGGLTAYHGNVKLEVKNVRGDETRTAGYSNIGTAAFDLEQFNISNTGDVSVKSGVINAGKLDGQDSTYYLDPSNLSSAIPVDRGGTGHSSYTNGQLLIGNNSATLSKGTLSGGANQISITNGSGSITIGVVDNLTTSRFTSNVATGTSPVTVTSTTLCSNLNADLLDGQDGTYYLNYTNFSNTPDLTKTLTLNTSGTGLSGSATYSANTNQNITFTVTSNATSANDADTIVSRDGSGNFSAGTITADLTGTASKVNITDDTSTASFKYLHFGDLTTGGDGVDVSSTKLVFKPSTGALGVNTNDPTHKLNVVGDVGIGTVANTSTNHMLDIASSKGSASQSAIKATYPDGGGLTNTEFAALAHRGSNWRALYAKQGSATSGLYVDGVSHLIGNTGVGTTTTTNARLQVSSGGGTSIYVGTSTRYFSIQEQASTSNFRYAEFRFNDNSVPSVIRLRNNYNGANFGVGIDFYGFNDNGNAFIRTVQDASNSAAARLQLSTTSNNGINITSSGNVGINTTSASYNLEVSGSFAATTKSFVIPHPTKEDYKLRYGSLEGPENGVYVRGRSTEFIIELPEYWTKLVDPDSITVNLTPIGKSQTLWVKDIKDNKVYIGSKCSEVKYFYTVFAERADVESLEVEVPII